MNNLLRYIRQNRNKIFLTIFFIIFVYSLIRVANNAATSPSDPDDEKKLYTIEDSGTANLSGKNCKKVINEFLEYCTKGNYEKAYTYLSEDCKKNLYPSLENFEEEYCIANSIKGKSYTIGETSDVSNYTYKITFNNMLSSGKKKSKETIDYYTIAVDNGEDIKLKINSYLYTNEDNVNVTINDSYNDTQSE